MPPQKVPGTERDRAWLGTTSHHGYPEPQLMTLVETGTRFLAGAVFGPTAKDRTPFVSGPRIRRTTRRRSYRVRSVPAHRALDRNASTSAVRASGTSSIA